MLGSTTYTNIGHYISPPTATGSLLGGAADPGSAGAVKSGDCGTPVCAAVEGTDSGCRGGAQLLSHGGCRERPLDAKERLAMGGWAPWSSGAKGTCLAGPSVSNWGMHGKAGSGFVPGGGLYAASGRAGINCVPRGGLCTERGKGGSGCVPGGGLCAERGRGVRQGGLGG